MMLKGLLELAKARKAGSGSYEGQEARIMGRESSEKRTFSSFKARIAVSWRLI